MTSDFSVDMNEYLPLRDVVFNTLRQAILKGELKPGERLLEIALAERLLKILNNIVSGYFDFAEIQAMRHNPMHMEDYVEHLDNVLKTTGEKVLQGAGTISHAQAIEKATEEYRKYQVQNLSPVEEEYLESIKNIHSTVKKNSKN